MECLLKVDAEQELEETVKDMSETAAETTVGDTAEEATVEETAKSTAQI